MEGASVHYNPTPGPAYSEWLYGHCFVCLAWLAVHPAWGVIALPVLSPLYVRAVDVPPLNEKYGWDFCTKHQLGVELMTWFMTAIRNLGVTSKVWLAVDGAYAAAPFLKPMPKLSVVVVSRLRKDPCLFDMPTERTAGQRGRPRIYGEHKISLAKRAAHKQGWETITYLCRGVEVTRQYKSFLATTQLTSGVIRVVIVRFDDGNWAPYFCTDSTAGVQDILEAVAGRWGIEEQFHDVKEVWGEGQQHVVEHRLLEPQRLAVRARGTVFLGRRRNNSRIAATDRGTTWTDVRFTPTRDAPLPGKCCRNNFSRSCQS